MKHQHATRLGFIDESLIVFLVHFLEGWSSIRVSYMDPVLITPEFIQFPPNFLSMLTNTLKQLPSKCMQMENVFVFQV